MLLKNSVLRCVLNARRIEDRSVRSRLLHYFLQNLGYGSFEVACTICQTGMGRGLPAGLIKGLWRARTPCHEKEAERAGQSVTESSVPRFSQASSSLPPRLTTEPTGMSELPRVIGVNAKKNWPGCSFSMYSRAFRGRQPFIKIISPRPLRGETPGDTIARADPVCPRPGPFRVTLFAGRMPVLKSIRHAR